MLQVLQGGSSGASVAPRTHGHGVRQPGGRERQFSPASELGTQGAPAAGVLWATGGRHSQEGDHCPLVEQYGGSATGGRSLPSPPSCPLPFRSPTERPQNAPQPSRSHAADGP